MAVVFAVGMVAPGTPSTKLVGGRGSSAGAGAFAGASAGAGASVKLLMAALTSPAAQAASALNNAVSGKGGSFDIPDPPLDSPGALGSGESRFL